MSSKNKFSIIIPSLGDQENLKPLLNSISLLHQLPEAEVLVVLNPPQKIDWNFFRQWNFQLKVLTSHRGVNCARNKGMQEAKGEILLFLDDDCTIEDPNLLLKHESHHKKFPEIFALGGHYTNKGQGEIHKSYHKIQMDWLYQNLIPGTLYCNTLLGGHFSIKNATDLPLFDEDIIYGGSETEYFFRIRKAGFKLMQFDASVEHCPFLSVKNFARKAYLQGITHYKMKNSGLFPSEGWQRLSRDPSNKYEYLYKKMFHLSNPDSKINLVALTAKNPFKLIHERLCFYLENRSSF